MSRFPKAKWIGPTPNRDPGGMVRPILGVVRHVQQGHEAGSESWLEERRSQASAHFLNPQTGGLRQLVDTNDKAWAEVAGNSRWISIEFEGFSGQPPAPTASQIENCAQLLAWLHIHEGVPLQVTNSPTRRGLGWHGMGGAAWGGHYDCPGDRIKNAGPQIIRRAKEIVAEGKPPKTQRIGVAHRAALRLVGRWKPTKPIAGKDRPLLDHAAAAIHRAEGVK